MAAETLQVVIETEMVGDMAAEIVLIEQRLASRHGDVFRALDRRLQRLVDSDLSGCFEVLDLEPDRLIVAPAGELRGVVAEARRLGVIP